MGKGLAAFTLISVLVGGTITGAILWKRSSSEENSNATQPAVADLISMMESPGHDHADYDQHQFNTPNIISEISISIEMSLPRLVRTVPLPEKMSPNISPRSKPWTLLGSKPAP